MLGSYQRDALQNIQGAFNTALDAYLTRAITNKSGAFANGQFEPSTVFTLKNGYTENKPELVSRTSLVDFDASRVARTSTETRASNTAFAPRIVAF